MSHVPSSVNLHDYLLLSSTFCGSVYYVLQGTSLHVGLIETYGSPLIDEMNSCVYGTIKNV